MDDNHIERAIPLPETAKRLGLSIQALTRLIKDGIIKAVELPDGEVVVSEQETDVSIKREDFHLRGKPTTVSEAAEKYGKQSASGRQPKQPVAKRKAAQRTPARAAKGRSGQK